METVFGVTTIPSIVIICYCIAQAIKSTPLKNKYIPIPVGRVLNQLRPPVVPHQIIPADQPLIVKKQLCFHRKSPILSSAAYTNITRFVSVYHGYSDLARQYLFTSNSIGIVITVVETAKIKNCKKGEP